jgi:hypothetical protein
MCEVPFGTLSGKVTSNEAARSISERGLGAPTLLQPEQQQVVVDCVRRADRANNGKSMPEVIDLIQELHGLERKQARDTYANSIKPSHRDKLTNIVKAQATTTARSAITVDQQWRWHQQWRY